MEQVVILVLFVLASIVSSIIQNKKKRDAESGHGDGSPAPSSPFDRWPETIGDWQEQLRRMLEDRPAPPPIVRPPAKQLPPVISKPARKPVSLPRVVEKSEGDEVFASPLRESDAVYGRAMSLRELVERRMRVVDERTTAHKPSSVPVRAVASQMDWKDRGRLREAFVASLIFSPPVTLAPPSELP